MNPYVILTACMFVAWLYGYEQGKLIEAECARQRDIMRTVAMMLGIHIDQQGGAL